MLVSALGDLLERRVNSRPAAVARIGVGIAVMMKAIERLPALEQLNDPEVIRVPYLADQPTLSDVPALAVVAVWLGLGAAFTLGARTTLTGSVLAVLLGLVLFSDQQLYSNHLYLLTWLVALLVLARSGSALSLDALRHGEAPTIPAWPVALLQLQVVVVYAYAGLTKINPEYLSGSVVAVSLRETGPLALPTAWQSFEPMAVASMLSILTEIGIALALMLPRWRRTAFVVGLGLHIVITLWLEPTLPLAIFGLMILAPYALFLDDGRGRLVVVWDDSCGFCASWVRWFRRLDWLDALRFVPNSDHAALAATSIARHDADRAIQVLGPEGRSEAFRGVVTVLEALPLTFLWAPLLRIWPVVSVGEAVYRRVALRRSCRMPAGQASAARTP